MRKTLFTLGLCGLVAAPVASQQKGTWEIGAFARYNLYDNAFDVVDSTKRLNSFGVGGRLGYFIADRWALELDGSFNATDLDLVEGGATSVGLRYWPFHLRAIYNIPMSERFSWLLGLGPNYNRYELAEGAGAVLEERFEGSDWGVGFLGGFRYKFTEQVAARVDVTADVIPSPKNDTGTNTQYGLQVGLSLLTGGRCRDRLDSIRVEPRNSTIMVGEQVTFRVTGFTCDGGTTDASPGTTARLAGGQASVAGMTFTSNTAGTYQVRFENPTARRRTTDVATVTVNAPPVVRVTLARVDLQPDNASVFVGEAVAFRVTGHYSDGTSRELTDCQLTPDGGAISNGSFSSTRAGNYTVTATCEAGVSDRSTVTVRGINITVQALFEFDRTNVHVRAELDSLRMVAQQLRDHPTLQLTLFGHTDAIGSDAYNCNLGWRRIQAVVDTLRSFGAPPEKLTAAVKNSFGEREPVAENDTPDNRRLNRRVEVFDSGSAKQYDAAKACGPRR